MIGATIARITNVNRLNADPSAAPPPYPRYVQNGVRINWDVGALYVEQGVQVGWNISGYVDNGWTINWNIHSYVESPVVIQWNINLATIPAITENGFPILDTDRYITGEAA